MTHESLQPLVAVIMPVFNASRFLGEAIESILAQTYKRFEFIIVDDCSTDNSWEIISEYSKQDGRVKALRNATNLKIAKTRNVGFRAAKSDCNYFAIFDSDDISYPTRLEKEVEFLEAHADHALIGSHTIIINDESEEIGLRRYPVSYEEINKVITRFNPFAQSAVMIRAAVLREGIGFYNEKYSRCQDYDLWLRIASRFKVENIDECLVKYRVSPYQGKTTHLTESLQFTIEIQRNWLFKKKFFRIYNVCFWMAEHLLLFLPPKLLLWLFKRSTYKSLK